jgi:hypothetical protein
MELRGACGVGGVARGGWTTTVNDLLLRRKTAAGAGAHVGALVGGFLRE